MYNLPDKWEQFYSEMYNRATIYIKIKYWDIKKENLDLWMQNFKTPHEKFLSSLIIYHLIYRNREPRLSMYRHIIEIILPQILKEIGLYDDEILDDFIDKIENKPWELEFKFSTIDNVSKNVSKSGSQLLREFRRLGSFHPHMEISLQNLPLLNKVPKAIVLFDDFMGTGSQFETFLNFYQGQLENLKIIYCPLAAHTEGLNYIKKMFPHIIIAPVEILDEKYSFFSKEYLPKIAENISSKDLVETYTSLLRKTKIQDDNYLGYGKQALTYIFDISSPNNSLPILTYKDDTWEQIFTR